MNEHAARRRLLQDVAGIALSIFAFAVVYGLAAHDAGLSAIETISMSLMPFAGASQFAVVGYLNEHLSWTVIVGLTALLNARHFLYSAALAPDLATVSKPQRAAMAQFLTDEAFALTTNHFKRLGRPDPRGYWIAAILGVYIPWNLGTAVGALAGNLIPDPATFGLDVVFPASMAGLAIGLVEGRRDVVAIASGVVIGVVVSLAAGTGVGVVAGGLIGPAVAMAAVKS